MRSSIAMRRRLPLWMITAKYLPLQLKEGEVCGWCLVKCLIGKSLPVWRFCNWTVGLPSWLIMKANFSPFPLIAGSCLFWIKPSFRGPSIDEAQLTSPNKSKNLKNAFICFRKRLIVKSRIIIPWSRRARCCFLWTPLRISTTRRSSICFACVLLLRGYRSGAPLGEGSVLSFLSDWRALRASSPSRWCRGSLLWWWDRLLG